MFFSLYSFSFSLIQLFFIYIYRLRLLGRTPPSLEYPVEEEHAETAVEEKEHTEKKEARSAAESLDESVYNLQFSRI